MMISEAIAAQHGIAVDRFAREIVPFLSSPCAARSRQLNASTLGGSRAERWLDHDRVLVVLRLTSAVPLRRSPSRVGCRRVVLGVVQSTLAQPKRKRTPVVRGVVPVSVVPPNAGARVVSA